MIPIQGMYKWKKNYSSKKNPLKIKFIFTQIFSRLICVQHVRVCSTNGHCLMMSRMDFGLSIYRIRMQRTPNVGEVVLYMRAMCGCCWWHPTHDGYLEICGGTIPIVHVLHTPTNKYIRCGNTENIRRIYADYLYLLESRAYEKTCCSPRASLYH